jgi:hypothetical protein
LARHPGAELVKHDPPGVRRCFHIIDSQQIIGEGRGPALAWRSAMRRIERGES